MAAVQVAAAADDGQPGGVGLRRGQQHGRVPVGLRRGAHEGAQPAAQLLEVGPLGGVLAQQRLHDGAQRAALLGEGGRLRADHLDQFGDAVLGVWGVPLDRAVEQGAEGPQIGGRADGRGQLPVAVDGPGLLGRPALGDRADDGHPRLPGPLGVEPGTRPTTPTAAASPGGNGSGPVGGGLRPVRGDHGRARGARHPVRRGRGRSGEGLRPVRGGVRRGGSVGLAVALRKGEPGGQRGPHPGLPTRPPGPRLLLRPVGLLLRPVRLHLRPVRLLRGRPLAARPLPVRQLRRRARPVGLLRGRVLRFRGLAVRLRLRLRVVFGGAAGGGAVPGGGVVVSGPPYGYAYSCGRLAPVGGSCGTTTGPRSPRSRATLAAAARLPAR